MDDTSPLTSTPHQVVRPETPVELAKVPRWSYSPATLRSIIASWRERRRFRSELDQKLRDDPHLIDDIGLTRQQAEAEIARPFWQVLPL